MTPERLRAMIERRAREQVPELAREITRAWDRLATKIDTARMARLIATGNIEAIFSEVLDELLMEVVFAEFERAYFRQALANVEAFGKPYGPAIGFGTLSPTVIDGIRGLDARVMDGLKGDVREVVRAYIEQGLRDGINPRTMARGVKDVVGMTAEQRQWVFAFRDELERNSRAALRRTLGRGTVTRPDGSTITRGAHAGGFGLNRKELDLLNRTLGSKEKLTAAQVNKFVGQYEKRLTAWHAESISRTAALQSNKMGQHLATQQAIDAGILDATRMMSEWITTMDGRERPEHHALNGTVVPFGGTFPTGDIVPGQSEYGCRCIKRDFQAREPVTGKAI